MKIKIVNKSNHPLPKYETTGSAGMDLRADLGKGNEVIIKPFDSKIIPTGLYIELPPPIIEPLSGEGYGYMAQVVPRSGLSAKHKLTITNSPGTIDSDYRGNVGVILYNLGSEDYVVEDGQKIAQMVISRYDKISWVSVDSLDELSDTKRGFGGFGSTGK